MWRGRVDLLMYQKTDWKDRIVQRPLTYTMQQNADGTVTLIPSPGTVTQQGTPVNAALLNKIEDGLVEATAQLATLDQVKADQSFVDLQFANIVSGAPKGTYTTLSALQAAYPTGTSGVFLVLANGHWYYWNGSIWDDGGLYQSTGIGNQAIHAKNLNDGLYDEILNGYPLNLKDLSLYTSAFTGAKNRIFISNTPLSDKGKVNIVFKSVSSHSFYVVLLEKNASSNQFTISNSLLINVGVGINTIETNFVSTGLGNQYIGIVGVTDDKHQTGTQELLKSIITIFLMKPFLFQSLHLQQL